MTGWRACFDAKRWAQLAAVVLVLGAAGYLASVPIYTLERITISETGEQISTTTFHTLGDPNGLLLALVVAAVPLLLTGLPLLVSGSARQPVSIACTVLLAAGVVISGFTVGFFFAPALFAAVVACVVPARRKRPPSVV